MQAIWGPLERLGFEPRFISKEELQAGEYKNLSAIILPRNQRLDSGDLLYLQNNVLSAGVNLYADADLPGMQSYYIQPNADFNQRMSDIWGIQVEQANAYQDEVVEYEYGVARSRVDIKTVNTFGSLPAAHSDYFWVWKYNKISNKNTTTVSGERILGETSNSITNGYNILVGNYDPSRRRMVEGIPWNRPQEASKGQGRSDCFRFGRVVVSS